MINKNELIVSKHAQKRTKNRVGISKKIADKNAQKALDFGVTHAEAKGKMKKFMDALYLKHEKTNNTRIYNRKVYLFHNQLLITVLHLPNQFSTTADKLQKKKLTAMQMSNEETA